MFSLALLNFFGNIRQLLPFKIQIKFDALASLTSCPFFIKDNRFDWRLENRIFSDAAAQCVGDFSRTSRRVCYRVYM